MVIISVFMAIDNEKFAISVSSVIINFPLLPSVAIRHLFLDNLADLLPNVPIITTKKFGIPTRTAEVYPCVGALSKSGHLLVPFPEVNYYPSRLTDPFERDMPISQLIIIG